MFHRNVQKDDTLGKSRMGTKDSLSSSYPPPLFFCQSEMFRRSITKDDALSRSRMFHRIRTQDDVLGFQDINSIFQDPDSAKTHRLDLILEAGFSHAAGIHFHTGGVDGIVIFFTSSEADNNNDSAFIRSAPNSFYMVCAAEIIGAVLASIGPCHEILAIKRRNMNSSKTEVTSTSKHDVSISKCMIQKGMKRWWRKCHGGNLQIPPAFSWGEGASIGMGYRYIFMHVATVVSMSKIVYPPFYFSHAYINWLTHQLNAATFNVQIFCIG